MTTNWNVHITVAAIIKHQDKFLLVTDNTHAGLKLNQPAGHVDDNESIIEAVIREVKEETSLDFQPQYIVGIYFAKLNPANSYLRICFAGNATGNIEAPCPMADDDGVIDAKWYSIEEIKQNQNMLRTPMVWQCITDFIAGISHPLNILANYANYCNE